jgi:hypothetical protein
VHELREPTDVLADANDPQTGMSAPP